MYKKSVGNGSEFFFQILQILLTLKGFKLVGTKDSNSQIYKKK
jgi:hypothetical protein